MHKGQQLVGVRTQNMSPWAEQIHFFRIFLHVMEYSSLYLYKDQVVASLPCCPCLFWSDVDFATVPCYLNIVTYHRQTDTDSKWLHYI